MKDQNCAYCMEGELVAVFGIKICELESSKVYLFKEQSPVFRGLHHECLEAILRKS